MSPPASVRAAAAALLAALALATAVVPAQAQNKVPPEGPLEALVKTYVGDAMAADLYLAIAGSLPDEVADVVRAVLAETGHSQFVVADVRAAVTASPRQRSRLALWSRRLLGEAITQAQYVLADHDELLDLVVEGGGLGRLSVTRR